MEPGISIIMPAYLGEYQGSRTRADVKFIRAVIFFLKQEYSNKELIIVSDGDKKVNELYDELWKNEKEVKLIKCEKVEARWPGILREVGRSYASNEWIGYLDTDDIFSGGHLKMIGNAINERKNNESVIFCRISFHPIPKIANPKFKKYCGFTEDTSDEEWLEFYNKQHTMRNGLGEDMKVIGRDFHDLAGTWCIVHKIDVAPRWQNKEQVGEDYDFIKRLREKERCVEVRTGGYVIMHMAGHIDF